MAPCVGNVQAREIHRNMGSLFAWGAEWQGGQPHMDTRVLCGGMKAFSS